MTVECEKAIEFKCEKCGKFQYFDYTLIPGWHEDRAVNEDKIICEKCEHLNHVIEEL